MKRINRFTNSGIWVTLLAGLTFGCQQNAKIPEHEGSIDFASPEAVPFTMPEGKPFTWKEVPKESIPTSATIKIDFDRLPSTPFDLQNEKPLTSPIQEIDYSSDKLKSFPLEITLDTISLIKEVRPMPAAIFSSLNTPEMYPRGNAGLLSVSESEGLIGTITGAQLITKNGDHWIATDKALHKVSRGRFEVYEIIPNSISGTRDFFMDLIALDDGRIMATTLNSGFYILDWENQLIEDYSLPFGFTRLDLMDDGRIWAGSLGSGLKIIDLENNSISSLSLPTEELGINEVYGTGKDSKGNIWLGFNNGFGVLTPEKKEVAFFGDYIGLTNSNSAFYDFLEDKEGTVWLFSYGQGLKGVSLTNQHIYSLGPEQGFSAAAVNLHLDEKERIWIGSNGSFTIYDPSKETLKQIKTNLNQTGFGPPSYSVLDASGLYWYGTSSDGLLLYDSQGIDSRHFDTGDGLVSDEIWGMGQDNQERVWMATYQGINIYDPKTETLKFLGIPQALSTNDHRGITFLSETEIFVGSVRGFSIIDLESNTLTAYSGKGATQAFFWRAMKDKNGIIWMASNNGLFLFDRNTNSMKQLDENSGLVGNTLWSITEPDQFGLIWLVSDLGVNAIDPDKKAILTLGKEEWLSGTDQSVIFQTSDRRLVIGGLTGLSILNQDRTKLTNINSVHGLIPQTLYDGLEVNGRLHIGSSNGIIVIDEPEETNGQWKFTNFNRDEGFPFSDYNQLSAFHAQDGAIWWAAAPYLTVVLEDPDTDREIPSEAFISGIKIMDQVPIFYDPKSKFSVETEESTSPINHSRAYLTENNIKWNGLTADTKMPVALSLPHHQNSLTFTFSNPRIRSRDGIEFKYALQGSDSDWSEPTPQSTSRTYFNLLPGEYDFKVITKGVNGKWSEPSVFSFTINPPWWLTWWAFTLYFFALGLLVYAVVQIRSSYLQRENRLLEERVNHRTAQLKTSIEDLKSTQEQLIQSEKMASLGELTAGIAHEIQNPLNFVNNFSEVSNELIQEIKEEQEKESKDEGLIKEILGDIEQNLTKINLHGKRADSIVKGMLQHSRNNSGQKEVSDINVIADEYLRLSYHGLRAKDKSFTADFKLDLDPDLPKLEIVPQDFGRVLLNLINNGFYAAGEKLDAMKAAGNPEAQAFLPTVTVSTKKISEGIEIRIRDNGNGIPEELKSKIFQPFFTTKPTGKGTGLGLSMSYEIITKGHEGILEVNSKSGEYTEFIIILPN